MTRALHRNSSPPQGWCTTELHVARSCFLLSPVGRTASVCQILSLSASSDTENERYPSFLCNVNVGHVDIEGEDSLVYSQMRDSALPS